MKLHTILALLATLALPLSASADPASETSKPELVVLNWADYIDPDLIVAFEARHHAKVRVVNFEDDDNRDQLLLATAGAGYDIVLVNETHVAVYRAHGWLAPLGVAQVPNLKHVDATWLDKAVDAKGYALPYFWGTLGIA